VGVDIFLQFGQCFILANSHNLAKKKKKAKKPKSQQKKKKNEGAKGIRGLFFGREKMGPIRHIMREKYLNSPYLKRNR
jgi:hypothetical protein